MTTMEQFVRENKISVKSELVDHNPNMDDFEGNHWKVALKRPNKQMTLYFSKGYGHNGKEPEVEEVLSCLISDADVFEYGFEDWAVSLGYDPDSRKAKRIWKTCFCQTNKLVNFLGNDLFEDLRFEIEPY